MHTFQKSINRSIDNDRIFFQLRNDRQHRFNVRLTLCVTPKKRKEKKNPIKKTLNRYDIETK